MELAQFKTEAWHDEAVRILMCRPEYFGVEYEINPWMHLNNQVNRQRAIAQWESLYQLYCDLGQKVELLEPVEGLPDIVFVANAGVIWNRKVVLSNFRYPERQGEETYDQKYFAKLGFEVTALPESVAFEGAGDALFVGDRLFLGHGFRSDKAAHPFIAEALDVETVSLQLVDPHFYHLDTCFCPLNDRTVMFDPDAFTPESVQIIRKTVPRLIEVKGSIAAGFACNAMVIGNYVISSLAAERLDGEFQDIGFVPKTLPMNEFMKAGGGVRCLTLPLDLGTSSAA